MARLVVKVISVLLIMAIIGSIASTAWFAMPKNSALYGLAYVAEPVSGATVSVYDLNGNKIFEQANATQANGIFILNVAWTWLWGVPTEFKITITGGTIAGSPFTGTLTRFVDNYNQNMPYVVNPITTLEAEYRTKNPSLSTSQIQQNLQDFLEIPKTVELSYVIDNADHSRQFFDTYEFNIEANTNGGFNTFIDTLSSQVGQTTHPFKGENLVSGTSSGIFAWTASSLASGAVSYLGGLAMGWVLYKLGYQSPEDKIIHELKAISQKLVDVDNKLDTVIADLSKISSQLQELKNALNAVDQDLSKKISETASYDPISKITSSYKALTVYSQCEPGQINNQTLNNFSNGILDSTNGVAFAMESLNNFIVGHVLGDEEGLLEQMADSMITELYQPGNPNAVRAGAVYLNKAYVLFEGYTDYFQKLLFYELQGLTLISEAHHYLNESALVKIYVDTVWKPTIEAQTKLYLSQVEKFVISVESYDPIEFPNMGTIPDDQRAAIQAFWTSKYNQDLPNVAQVFPAADLFVGQLFNVTGKFTARIMYSPISLPNLTPDDPKPVFMNVQTHKYYTANGELKTVPVIGRSPLVIYYRTYDLGSLPAGNYILVTPTAALPSDNKYWIQDDASLLNAYWSFGYGYKMSRGSLLGTGTESYIEVHNDENGFPYGFWGGVWFDKAIDKSFR